MKNFNKKLKKSYNTGELDLDKLSDELIKPKQFSNKDSVTDKRKRRK